MGFDPSLKCLTTLKSCDTTKLSVGDYIYIYIYIYIWARATLLMKAISIHWWYSGSGCDSSGQVGPTNLLSFSVDTASVYCCTTSQTCCWLPYFVTELTRIPALGRTLTLHLVMRLQSCSFGESTVSLHGDCSLIGWLVVWVLWHINICRSFNAKFCLYIHTYSTKDFKTNIKVGKIFYLQDYSLVYSGQDWWYFSWVK